MQHTIEELKRIQTCPILHKNKWDFKMATGPSGLDRTVRYGLNSIFKWHSRRGNPITYDVLESSISTQFFQTKRKDHEKLIEIQEAFRRFMDKGFYSRIKDPVFNHEIMIYITNKDTLKYNIPLLTFHREILYCVFYDKEPDDFHLSLEAQAIAMWAFYTLDQFPRFLFYSYEDGDIKENIKRYNIDYVQDAKRNLALLGRSKDVVKAYPEREVCLSCERRSECPRTTKKWLKE